MLRDEPFTEHQLEYALKVAAITRKRFLSRLMYAKDAAGYESMAYFAALKGLRWYRPERGTALSTYLVAVIWRELQREYDRQAFNYSKGSYRKCGIHEVSIQAVERSEFYVPVALRYDIGELADRRLMRRGEWEKLHRAVAELPTEFRKVIHAIFWEDRGLSDIARDMQQSRQAIHQRRNRALKLLREQLQRQEFDLNAWGGV